MTATERAIGVALWSPDAVEKAAMALQAALWPSLPVDEGAGADAGAIESSAGESTRASTGNRLARSCAMRGLECRGLPLDGRALARALGDLGAGIIEAPGTASGGFFVVLASGRSHLTLLGPGAERLRVSIDAAAAWLYAAASPGTYDSIGRLVDAAGLSGRQRAAVIRRQNAERHAGRILAKAWRIRPARSASSIDSPYRRAPRVLLLQAAQLGAQTAAFLVLLRGALDGGTAVLAPLGWLLLAAAAAIGALAARDREALVATLAAGARRRHFLGALHRPLATATTAGPSLTIVQVAEVEGIEALSLAVTVTAALGTLTLVLGVTLLFLGAAPRALPALLGGWLALGVGAAAIRHRRQSIASSLRRAASTTLLERLLGHRTRLVQEPRAGWEDEMPRRLEHLTAAADHAHVVARSLAGRGYTLAAACVLYAVAADATPERLVLSIGGVLLTASVLSNLAAAAELGTEAHAALLRVRALFEPTAPGRAFEALPTVEVSAHDRVQIEGPPGSGKSTLAARLAGLADTAEPDPAPGSARVALAPQPHHNAVFAGTLAFNLLAGPRWPASPADLEDARAVCHALGLGPLLERMPAGLGQIVGDMGWRLSHGERARLFIARALLQGCETLVLDDALGALDPESRLQVLGEVRRRARRLVLVAPP